MKKLFLVAIVSVFSILSLSAQDKDKDKLKKEDVPQAIRTAFESQFSNAADVEWKMKEGNYKAMFTVNNKKQGAEFSSTGELLSKSEKIENSDLPKPVADAVKLGYANAAIDEVYRVEKGGQTHYMVKLAGDNQKKLVYDSDGKLIKEKKY